MRSVPERIAFQLQRLANEVAADLTPAAVARVTAEKITSESTSENIEIAVEVALARKVAKPSPRSPSIKRAVDAALKAGASVVIAPDKTVTITAPAAPANDIASNGRVSDLDRELEEFARRHGQS
jgi:hypothetical protein